jgi:hypothetical protein
MFVLGEKRKAWADVKVPYLAEDGSRHFSVFRCQFDLPKDREALAEFLAKLDLSPEEGQTELEAEYARLRPKVLDWQDVYIPGPDGEKQAVPFSDDTFRAALAEHQVNRSLVDAIIYAANGQSVLRAKNSDAPDTSAPQVAQADSGATS